jgi:hypothetical protein
VRLMNPRLDFERVEGNVYIRFDNDLECNALHFLIYIISY